MLAESRINYQVQAREPMPGYLEMTLEHLTALKVTKNRLTRSVCTTDTLTSQPIHSSTLGIPPRKYFSTFYFRKPPQTEDSKILVDCKWRSVFTQSRVCRCFTLFLPIWFWNYNINAKLKSMSVLWNQPQKRYTILTSLNFSLRRGFKVFSRSCQGCHGAMHQKYDLLVDKGFRQGELAKRMVFLPKIHPGH